MVVNDLTRGEIDELKDVLQSASFFCYSFTLPITPGHLPSGVLVSQGELHG